MTPGRVHGSWISITCCATSDAAHRDGRLGFRQDTVVRRRGKLARRLGHRQGQEDRDVLAVLVFVEDDAWPGLHARPAFRSSGAADQAGLIALSLVLAVLVVFRRKHPSATFAIALAIGLLQLALGTRPTSGTALSGAFQPVSADVAIIVLLYTLAARRPRRVSLYGLAACLIGIVIAVIRWPLSHGAESPQHMLAVALVVGVPTVSAWVLGNSMGYRRAYYAWLEDRARRAEAERDTRAQIAVAAERARIAREMHDVIAHNVSVIVVQADGAAYAFDHDPARAREAIGAISRTGRQAPG